MSLFTTLFIFIASAIGTYFIGTSLIVLGVPKILVIIGMLIFAAYLFYSPEDDTSE